MNEQPLNNPEVQALNSLLDQISGDTFQFKYEERFGIFLIPKFKEKVIIGGYGVTRRNLDSVFMKLGKELELSIPSANSILFIGNGLSLSPIELKKLNPDKKIGVVDMISYSEFKTIYLNSGKTLAEIEQKFPRVYSDIKKFFDNAISILQAAEKGEITIYHHVYGSSKKLESSLYDLGINCYGPDKSSMNEQLESITPGGKIIYRDTGNPVQVFNR